MIKRILLVCHGYPFETIGGVGQVVEQLVQNLPMLGWEVHVLVPKPCKWNNTLQMESVQTAWGSLHILNRPIQRWSEAWNSKATNQFLVDWTDNLQPDVIHIHHLNALPWKWLITTKYKNHTRLWLTLHDYALPCARGQLLNTHLQVCEGPTIERCLECIQPWLGLDGWQRQGFRIAHSPSPLVKLRLEEVKDLLSACDYIDAPSMNMIAQFQKLYPDLQVEHCKLPMPRLKHHIPSQRSNSDHRLLFVGSIHPSKGVDILLRAFKEIRTLFPDSVLTLIGPSTQCDFYPQYSQIWEDYAKQVDGTRWMGPLSHEDTMKQMATHDTLVLPSVWKENSPIVVREALQRGLNVVSGRGGSHELSKNIIQATPLSVFHLKQTLIEILKTPRPTPIVYPPALETIQNWIECAVNEHIKGD